MAVPVLSLAEKTKQVAPFSSADLNQCLRTAEDQRALAQEMIKRVRDMCERAAEMRRPPRFALR